MNGKFIASLIVLCALVAGVAIYYLQVYGYYYEVTPKPGKDVSLVVAASGEPEIIPYADFRAIDADSSPIRYRACFTTTLSDAELAARYAPVSGGEPLVAPGWFDCFDAEEIGTGIEAGRMHIYLSVKNIAYGVDRVVAVAPDGRGWAWHELNNCGRKAYDGTPVGEDCPPRPEGGGS
ncbi:MAG: DUF6446 family protein [Pseudodonghicola sp.]